MDLHADFLIIGSGIAGLRAAVELAARGRRADPHQGRPAREQHRLRAGRHCRRGRRRRFAGAARGRHDRRRRRAVRRRGGRGARRGGPALRARADRLGRARSIATPTARRRWRAKAAHSVRRVLHARDATGREIGRALWARASPALASVASLDHARVVELDRRGRRAASACGFCDATASVRDGRARARCCSRPAAPGRSISETTNPAVATGDGVAMA